MLDPRIEHVVAEVNQDVDQNHQRGDHQHSGLHLRIVAMIDRVEHELADAGQTEHLLNHDCARDEVRGGDADRGYHRQQRIAKTMMRCQSSSAFRVGSNSLA